MRFVWDPAKAALNYMKHGVSFGDAITAFDDPTGHYVPDPNHPERGNLIGHDVTRRLLFVVHVELLAEDPPATRIISARRAEAPERKRYQAQFEASKAHGRRPKRPPKERRSDRPIQPKKSRRRHEE